MTNLKKIIFVNIILTFLLYLCCDYYVYNKWKKISISQKTYIYENLNFVNDIFIFPISNFSRAIKLADEEKGKSERIFLEKLFLMKQHIRKNQFYYMDAHLLLVPVLTIIKLYLLNFKKKQIELFTIKV